MHRSRKKRNIIIFSLLGVLLCMTIGYAAYSTNLQISGTSKVTSSWDIRITGITAGTPTGSAENTVAPTFTNTTATMEANLYDKGDAMEYDVTIENKGTIDAKLNDIITNIENANSDAVSITFSGYTKGEKLLKGTAKVIHVKIAYNPNYEGGETSSEVEVKFDYTQNNNETEAPENTFLVTYDCTTNGGNDCSSNNEYLASGSNIDLTKTGTKKYYNFIGWNTNKDATEGLTSLTVAQNDITLYAIFEPSDTTPPIIDSINTTSTTNSITAVVAAHDDESNISKYEFSINNGEYIDNGTSNVYTFTGLTEGTGYTIKARVTNGVGMQSEKETEKDIDLTEDVVTTGDGLYADSYEEGKYIYRGSNPNNYITYNNETWRILSIEKDGTIKIVRNEVLEDRAFDTASGRYSSGTYCNRSSLGCNIWGSKSTLYNASGSAITTLPYQVGGTSYTLPTAVSDLNTYLNGTYYNSTLSPTARGQIEPSWFNVGPVSHSSSYTLTQNIEQSKAARWKGNIGLIDAIEYVKASTNSACDSVYDFYSNSSCYNNSQNYLDISDVFWTLSPFSGSDSRLVFYVLSGGDFNYSYADNSRGVRPAISLKSTVKIVGGTGTEADPYKLGSGTGTKEISPATFTEEDITEEKEVTTESKVEVTPSTSGSYAWTQSNGVWKSGNYQVNSSTSTLSFSFTLDSTQTLSFDWSVSSESTSYDYLYYTITKDGSTMSGTGTSTKIGGTSYGTSESSLKYLNVTKSLDPGSYVVTFTYRKDSSQHTGLDRGYVKNFDAGTTTTTTTTTEVVGKKVTIHFPKGCGDNLTCTYKKDENEEVTVTSDTATVEFNLSGTVVANITDGSNIISSSYTVTLPIKAVHLSYDNSNTGMNCEDAQCALDELKRKIDQLQE